MERTGGEPDVVGHDAETGEFIFCDCSSESPIGRRSICCATARLSTHETTRRKRYRNGVLNGIEILTEQQYRELQELGKTDEEDFGLGENPRQDKRFLVVRSSVIVATTMFLCIITALNHTTPPEARSAQGLARHKP